MNVDLSTRDLELLVEALAMAAARHESMGHVTKDRFRFKHDDKAERMRELRRALASKALEQQTRRRR